MGDLITTAIVLLGFSCYTQGEVCEWTQHYASDRSQWVLNGEDKRVCTSHSLGGLTVGEPQEERSLDEWTKPSVDQYTTSATYDGTGNNVTEGNGTTPGAAESTSVSSTVQIGNATIGKDCQDLYDGGIRENGIYTINPLNGPASGFAVYCSMTSDGGWTVFQRRVDGSIDFYRDWASYKTGFGDMTKEFWLGNEKLYNLTNQRSYQLRIDFVSAHGLPYYAEYSTFSVSNESDYYRLGIGTYNGTVGDALDYHRGSTFTTKDRDNDAHKRGNCAVTNRGAWWYKSCQFANLNGAYSNSDTYGLRWKDLPGIKYTEMKIRPA